LISLEAIVLGLCVFLFFSTVSFDIGDSPSTVVYPNNIPTKNLCGPIGAFISYYLLYYIGPGIYPLLLAAAGFTLALLAGKEVNQPILRIVGLALIVTACSASFYLLWPVEDIWPYTAGGFVDGNGGVLGIAVGHFIMRYFAPLGTTIVIVCCWLVGFLLLADRAVVAFFRAFMRGIAKLLHLFVPAIEAAKRQGESLNEIWHKLSLKQKLLSDEQSKQPRRRLFKIRGRSVEMPEEKYHPTRSQASSSAGVNEGGAAVNTSDSRALRKKRKKDRKKGKDGGRTLFDNVGGADAATGDAVGSTVTDGGSGGAATAKFSGGSSNGKALYREGEFGEYELPPLDLLAEPEYGFAAVQERMVGQKAKALEALLEEFGVDAHVVNAEPGPAITMYELELAPGIKVNQITNLSNDMARALGAGSVRVVAPMPGKHTIGIEVPNSQRETVRIKELLERASNYQKMAIPIFLGKSSSGEVLFSDMASMPHLLIAGTTGSGKSVCINSIIASILLTKLPDEVKLILIDPKMVEMAIFENIPHLMCPTVTDTRKSEQILEWATTKMDERYELLAEAGVRNLAAYNKLTTDEIIERFNPSTPEEEAKIPKKMPHIVIIIDELADLMMTSAKEVEAYIVRIAQKSRAVGIHLIVATQRPQATVVTGLIKSNMPARIAFRVAARMDSRIILDQNGGETLLGEGDMLFLKPGTSDLVRAQGAFMDDAEIRSVVKYLKEVAEPKYHPELMQLNKVDVSGIEKDELFDDAVQIVLETKRGSVSLLQRRLSIGYARASRIIEMMAAAGVLGEYKGSQAREVIMTPEDYANAKRQMMADAAAGYKDLNEDKSFGDADEDYDEDDDEDYEGDEDDHEDEE
jgi:S-DNA-T family DNA segregation ATPase FtsK/SpoIIIE